MAAFLTEFPQATREQQQAILDEPPPSTGDPRWDTLIAAMAEHLALHLALTSPRWTQDSRHELIPAWFPLRTPGARLDALRYAPASFACRGVFLDRRALERV